MTTAVSGGFQLTPSDGLNNTTTYQTTPANETAARQQFMDMYWQLMNEMNLPTLSAAAFAQYNKLINGNFDVWQRGTSWTNPTSGTYTADRWKVGFDGTGQAATVSQQAFTVGQTSVPKEPKYYYRYQVTTAATGQTYNSLQHFIESVRTFAGQKCTLSFWAKADAARTISATLRQFFGTGGSPSAIVDTGSSSFSLTTAWQKFTFTFTLPSISGKTLGTNGDDALGLLFFLPTSAIMTIDFAQAQINAGDQVLPFQPRSFADESAMCQRYYESFRYPSSYINNGVIRLSGTIFRVPKRITPTTTISGVKNIESGSAISTTFTPLVVDTLAFTLISLGNTGLISSGLWYEVVGNVDAEL